MALRWRFVPVARSDSEEEGLMGRRPILDRRRRRKHACTRSRRDSMITNDPVDHVGLAEGDWVLVVLGIAQLPFPELPGPVQNGVVQLVRLVGFLGRQVDRISELHCDRL